MSDEYIQNLFAERIGGAGFGKDTTIYKFEKIKRLLFLFYHFIAVFRVKHRFFKSFIDTFIISLYQKRRIRFE